MTLEELDNTLPNGLHDARIARLSHNYEEASLKLDIEILVGLPDEPKSNTYRNATVTFSKVLFSVVQMPENERIFGTPGSIWFIFESSNMALDDEQVREVLRQHLRERFKITDIDESKISIE